MLTGLYIQNVAVIRKAEIRLVPGLNVFTGETGAGKTILISALDAVLGERAAREMIRTGEDRCVVSAIFENISPAALAALRELGYEDDDGTLLITRELLASGKSSGKINGMPATASILKRVSSLLIHIHGQRDAAQVLSPERHIEMIDAFGALEDEVLRFREVYTRLRELEGEIEKLTMDEKQKAQKIDMLTFQIEEIDAAALDDPEEEHELTARRKLIGAGEKVLGALTAAYQALRGTEEIDGIEALFDTLSGSVAAAGEYIPSLSPMAARLEEIGYELEEYAAELREHIDGCEFDPREQSDIERRLDIIHRLKRKYGPDISAIIDFCENAREELEAITTGGERLEKLSRERDETSKTARELAQRLTELRRQAAESFTARVEEQLAFLDMPNISLSARREEKPLSHDGWDNIAFYVSTNVGEELRPLHKIASGGEISRMMLAIKNVLADKDGIDTLIFDEVDIGVSGRAAGKIGQKLAEVSRNRQVVCVTHLAQVAAYADHHLLIRKEVTDRRTHTEVRELTGAQREAELARIVSGDAITETALENARELIGRARELKSTRK